MRLWIGLLALAGCVSTEMRSYVGRDISEVLIAYGQPENVIPLPDGRRAFQFRYGGGPVIAPGTSTTTITDYGRVATANTVSTPGAILMDDGCLLTFIAAPSGQSWRVTDIRAPRELVC